MFRSPAPAAGVQTARRSISAKAVPASIRNMETAAVYIKDGAEQCIPAIGRILTAQRVVERGILGRALAALPAYTAADVKMAHIDMAVTVLTRFGV